jgi:acetoin utilization deacetylase AcuC-like enzyme
MTTLLLSHESFAHHEVPEGHPERPARMRAVQDALAAPAYASILREPAQMGTAEQAKLVHAAEYIDEIFDISPGEGFVGIDSDTFVSAGTREAVLRAVGGCARAVDAVFAREVRNAFVASRPPGHHAEWAKAMGFCFVNTAAMAARYAQSKHGAERVAIIDWDVHHGNGTQDIFWADKSVLYASTHQMPLYPGSGEASETGEHDTILNVPLAEGDDGLAFMQAFRSVILPRVVAFKPDLIVISAGFDAHHRDPLGGLRLTEEDFAWATRKLMELADTHAGGRVISVLEGGYDLKGLADSAAAHVAALMEG